MDFLIHPKGLINDEKTAVHCLELGCIGSTSRFPSNLRISIGQMGMYILSEDTGIGYNIILDNLKVNREVRGRCVAGWSNINKWSVAGSHSPIQDDPGLRSVCT